MQTAMVRTDLRTLRPALGNASQMLKTLGNERRMTILLHLAQGEHSVGALESLIGMRQPALSQQLARLREEGIVATRRESRTIYYRLCCPRVAALLEHVCQLFPDEGSSGH